MTEIESMEFTKKLVQIQENIANAKTERQRKVVRQVINIVKAMWLAMEHDTIKFEQWISIGPVNSTSITEEEAIAVLNEIYRQNPDLKHYVTYTTKEHPQYSQNGNYTMTYKGYLIGYDIGKKPEEQKDVEENSKKDPEQSDMMVQI